MYEIKITSTGPHWESKSVPLTLWLRVLTVISRRLQLGGQSLIRYSKFVC